MGSFLIGSVETACYVREARPREAGSESAVLN